MKCKAALDASITEEDVFRNYEAQQLSERAMRIAGNEAGRQWMIGAAWAMQEFGHDFEDLLTRVMTTRLKGLLEQVRGEVKRLESLVKQQRATATELRIAADRAADA